MMKAERAIEKIIGEQWLNAFPQLSVYEKNKFYKVIGPIIIGIELIKLPMAEEYRPHFVLYGLWSNWKGKDLKACLSGPYLIQEFYDNRGFQYNIPYSNSGNILSEATSNIRGQLLIPFDGDVSLNIIIKAFKTASKKAPLSHAPNSFLQASLQETLFNISLYIGVHQAKAIFEGIAEWPWDENHFKLVGRDVYQWLSTLKNRIESRDEFLEVIDNNKKDIKLWKVSSSQLTE